MESQKEEEKRTEEEDQQNLQSRGEGGQSTIYTHHTRIQSLSKTPRALIGRVGYADLLVCVKASFHRDAEFAAQQGRDMCAQQRRDESNNTVPKIP